MRMCWAARQKYPGYRIAPFLPTSGQPRRSVSYSLVTPSLPAPHVTIVLTHRPQYYARCVRIQERLQSQFSRSTHLMLSKFPRIPGNGIARAPPILRRSDCPCIIRCSVFPRVATQKWQSPLTTARILLSKACLDPEVGEMGVRPAQGSEKTRDPPRTGPPISRVECCIDGRPNK